MKNLFDKKEVSNVVDGKPTSESVALTFSCPTTLLVKQLLTEVRSLKEILKSQNPNQNIYLDNNELMREFKISRTCAQTWRNSGMPWYKAQGKLYYKRSEVEEFINRGKRRGF